jgi:transposase InsO family protein
VYSDHYTKGAHFVATRTTADAMTVIDHHIKHIFPLHGAPEKFVSDREPQFAAHMTQDFYKRLGIKQALTTAYHLQANGQTEQTNQDLVRYLRCHAGK